MTKLYSLFMNENLVQLDKFTKVIAKVHGENHPELQEVREIFLQIKTATQQNQIQEINDLFVKLTQVTHNYVIPNDACPTYAITYERLKQANDLINSK